MDAALYHPDWGYYAGGAARVGRAGDFFTSVSVGECFGLLLARRLDAWWRENNRPSRWTLAEQGANDGRLLADILRHLPAGPLDGVDIHIIEPVPALRRRQTDTLAAWRDRLSWHDKPAPPARPGTPVVFLANELLDAFPVERVLWRDGRWLRLHVVTRPTDTGLDAASAPFDWLEVPLPPELAPFLPQASGTAWPDGYTTEICPALAPWARALAAAVPAGLVLLIDYGFEDADYYHPSRRDGTLRTYCKHQATDNPFAAVGNSDITAHVPWTAASRALADAGFIPGRLLDQGRWLTRLAAPWLLEMEAAGPPAQAAMKRLRQFQTLTDPRQMGGKFQVMEAIKPPASFWRR